MRYESDWWLGGFLGGIITGLIITLIYTWYLVPITPTTRPSDLNLEDKETYILLISAAYRHDNDLEKAKRRLARLEDRNINTRIADMAEAYVNKGADVRDIRSLVKLADALGETQSFMLVYLATPIPSPTFISKPVNTPTPSPTSTPTPAPNASPTRQIQDTPTLTATPSPTASPTITLRTPPTPPIPAPNDPFQLAQSVALCDNNDVNKGVLRIYVRDWQGNGVPGVEVLVSWPGGQDKLFTGLKPEINPGYADFEMEANQTYEVALISLSATVAKGINQAAHTLCLNQLEEITPSWQVVFQQGNS